MNARNASVAVNTAALAAGRGHCSLVESVLNAENPRFNPLHLSLKGTGSGK